MKGITQRQQDVLSYIGEYVEEKGFPPAMRDSAKRFNLAPAAGGPRIPRVGYRGKVAWFAPNRPDPAVFHGIPGYSGVFGGVSPPRPGTKR